MSDSWIPTDRVCAAVLDHRAKVPLGLPTKVHPVEITSKRQENDEEDEDHHRNFNAACSAL